MREFGPFVLLLSLLPPSLPGQVTTVSSASFSSARMCYDQVRQRLVSFLPDSVREWNGTRWGEIGGGAIGGLESPVYFPARQAVLGTMQGDLVAYDGHAFQILGPVPWGNTAARLLVDTATDELVALRSNAINGADHWRWDGASWQPLPPLPPQQILLSAVFDVGRGVVVVETVAFQSGVHFETVEWDGTAWTSRHSDALSHGRLVYDHANQRVIGVRSGAMWSWDGSTWTFHGATPGLPDATQLSADPAGGRVWMLAGTAPDQRQVWAWDGAGWSAVAPHHAGVVIADFTFDAARQCAVLFGWNAHMEWDGHEWSEVPTLAGLALRQFRAQVYDAARQETVVFGGTDASFFGDTWAWNGVAWRLAATTGPTPRHSAHIAYDDARQRVVLVGGYDGAFRSDHWEWDGVAWTLVAASTPMGNGYGAMGHDPLRARTVFVDNVYRTWEYDGVAWTLVTMGPVRVEGSGSRSLAWDGQRQRLQGALRTQTGPVQRYEWDGQQWSLVGRDDGPLCYDPVRSVMLTYTGERLLTTTAAPARVTSYGSACGGQGVATTLTAFGLPRPGGPGFLIDLRAEATLRPALVGFAFGAANLSIGNGCALLLQGGIASRIWFTDADGLLHVPLHLPNDLSLRGLSFTAQGAVLDPLSPGGIALTQGLRLSVGD